MESQTEGVGIKIYSPSPQVGPSKSSSPKPVLDQELPPVGGGPGDGGHRKRKLMANGVQKTLSKTSMLVNFLPTGTLLTFEMVLPSIYGKGECSHVTTMMIDILLGICTISCFFFHFTDSFKGPDGKMYYGFVTPKGLAVFRPKSGVEVPKDERYKLSLSDLVHALMSALVFAAIAFSDHRVTDCFFPGHKQELDEVMRSFPLMVGIICSGLFLIFPTNRSGIGCMSA
ncbi:hypothetical protein Leryth_015775 [Lithospermum erythrorhizon]|uniref:Uncharacterized protein n=1 Tax=Lithospermum erythrorhizon TaxID=34254 RepID=A0AAV3PZT2_LITER|nr:hypothetical protein Leryth_015775 [Lithospermum erythrorhizon]